MKNKDIRVAIIDNSIDHTIYDPVHHWTQFLNVKQSSFRAKESDFPKDIRNKFTHIILTGSEASIMDRSPWVLDEIEWVKEAVSYQIPLLGSCYGHQMIALALEGPDCVRRSSFPEIGWIPIEISKKNALLGKKGCFYSYTIHFDEVIGLGDGYDIFASTDLCSIHAYQKKNSSVWGIQSHPEITPEEGKKLLKNLIEQGRGPLDIYKKALHSKPKDSGIIKNIIDAFLKY